MKELSVNNKIKNNPVDKQIHHIPEYWIPSSMYAAISSLGWMFSNSRRKDSLFSGGMDGVRS